MVHYTDQNNYRYIEVLDYVVKGYNASEHSSTGYAPKDVTHGHVDLILGRSSGEPIDKPPQFKVGDTVRVSTSKLTFEKGYETNYSEMIFRITEVRESDGHVLYRIADLANKGQPGSFYEQELSKVILDERQKHRIAKIIRQRKVRGRTQYLVNSVGYPSSFDSWEYADDIE